MGPFIAKEDIAVGEALAYARGQRVEADAVKANGWEALVVGEGTREAAAVMAELGHQPAESETKTSGPAKSATAKTEG